MEFTYHNRGLLAYLQDQLDLAVMAFMHEDGPDVLFSLHQLQTVLLQTIDVFSRDAVR